MRLAVVSDIHGSRHALESVIADLRRQSPDLVVHGGDLAVNGAHPEEVVTRIRELGWPGVIGNTDEMLWRLEELPEVIKRMPRLERLLRALYEHTAPATLERLGEENLRWLRALPHEFRHEDIALVHASPADLWRAPLPADDDEAFRTAYGPLGAGYVVYGHIHRPFVRVVDNMTVANSGSAGLTWDGDPRASYLLVDDGHLEIRRLEYRIDRDIDDLLATAYPYAEWLAAMRRSGSYVQPPAV